MRRKWIKKITVSLILVIWFFVMPQRGFSDYNPIDHIYGMLSHANIFHLACNVFCLCSLKNRIRILPSVIIGFACSFAPSWYENTLGFSGVIFAILGIEWGEVGQFKRMCRLILPFILITLLIPNMNAMYHLYSLMGGYLYGIIIKRYEGRRQFKQREDS